jgi:hypothetical protein
MRTPSPHSLTHSSTSSDRAIAPLLRQHAREPAKVVDGGLGRERVHAAQTAASAALALAVCALARDDSRDGACSCAGAGACSGCAACENGDGGRDGGSGGVDVLDGRVGEAGAVLADGEVLEIRHRLVACCGRVDAEDHAFAAVDTVLLLAVEPCGVC